MSHEWKLLCFLYCSRKKSKKFWSLRLGGRGSSNKLCMSSPLSRQRSKYIGLLSCVACVLWVACVPCSWILLEGILVGLVVGEPPETGNKGLLDQIPSIALYRVQTQPWTTPIISIGVLFRVLLNSDESGSRSFVLPGLCFGTS